MVNPVYTYGFVKTMANQQLGNSQSNTTGGYIPGSGYSLNQQPQYSAQQFSSSSNQADQIRVAPIAASSPVVASPLSAASEESLTGSPPPHHQSFVDFSGVEGKGPLNGEGPTSQQLVDLLGNLPPRDDPSRNDILLDFSASSLSLANEELLKYSSRALSIGDISTTASPDALSSSSSSSSGCQDRTNYDNNYNTSAQKSLNAHLDLLNSYFSSVSPNSSSLGNSNGEHSGSSNFQTTTGLNAFNDAYQPDREFRYIAPTGSRRLSFPSSVAELSAPIVKTEFNDDSNLVIQRSDSQRRNNFDTNYVSDEYPNDESGRGSTTRSNCETSSFGLSSSLTYRISSNSTISSAMRLSRLDNNKSQFLPFLSSMPPLMPMTEAAVANSPSCGFSSSPCGFSTSTQNM